jgi:hypothetical protein
VCTSKNERAARGAQDDEAMLRRNPGDTRRKTALAVMALALLAAVGCVTVRPEQRAILADPVMQFQSDPREAAQRQHVLDNREGSFGGTSVQGGGCGCN